MKSYSDITTKVDNAEMIPKEKSWPIDNPLYRYQQHVTDPPHASPNKTRWSDSHPRQTNTEINVRNPEPFKCERGCPSCNLGLFDKCLRDDNVIHVHAKLRRTSSTHSDYLHSQATSSGSVLGHTINTIDTSISGDATNNELRDGYRSVRPLSNQTSHLCLPPIPSARPLSNQTPIRESPPIPSAEERSLRPLTITLPSTYPMGRMVPISHDQKPISHLERADNMLSREAMSELERPCNTASHDLFQVCFPGDRLTIRPSDLVQKPYLAIVFACIDYYMERYTDNNVTIANKHNTSPYNRDLTFSPVKRDPYSGPIQRDTFLDKLGSGNGNAHQDIPLGGANINQDTSDSLSTLHSFKSEYTYMSPITYTNNLGLKPFQKLNKCSHCNKIRLPKSHKHYPSTNINPFNISQQSKFSETMLPLPRDEYLLRTHEIRNRFFLDQVNTRAHPYIPPIPIASNYMYQLQLLNALSQSATSYYPPSSKHHLTYGGQLSPLHPLTFHPPLASHHTLDQTTFPFLPYPTPSMPQSLDMPIPQAPKVAAAGTLSSLSPHFHNRSRSLLEMPYLNVLYKQIESNIVEMCPQDEEASSSGRREDVLTEYALPYKEPMGKPYTFGVKESSYNEALGIRSMHIGKETIHDRLERNDSGHHKMQDRLHDYESPRRQSPLHGNPLESKTIRSSESHAIQPDPAPTNKRETEANLISSKRQHTFDMSPPPHKSQKQSNDESAHRDDPDSLVDINIRSTDEIHIQGLLELSTPRLSTNSKVSGSLDKRGINQSVSQYRAPNQGDHLNQGWDEIPTYRERYRHHPKHRPYVHKENRNHTISSEASEEPETSDASDERGKNVLVCQSQIYKANTVGFAGLSTPKESISKSCSPREQIASATTLKPIKGVAEKEGRVHTNAIAETSSHSQGIPLEPQIEHDLCPEQHYPNTTSGTDLLAEMRHRKEPELIETRDENVCTTPDMNRPDQRKMVSHDSKLNSHEYVVSHNENYTWKVLHDTDHGVQKVGELKPREGAGTDHGVQKVGELKPREGAGTPSINLDDHIAEAYFHEKEYTREGQEKQHWQRSRSDAGPLDLSVCHHDT